MAIKDNYIKYIDIYDSPEKVKTALDNGELHNPYVALVETASGSSIDYNTDEPTDYSKEYFTMEITSAGSGAVSSQVNLYYSKNGGEWTACNSAGTTDFLNLQVGDKIRFKGDLNTRKNAFRYWGDSHFKVYGNLMSLLYEDYFENAVYIPDVAENQSGYFASLLQNSNVVDASNLIFPKQPDACAVAAYKNMFSGCDKLVYGPKVLPDLVLKQSSYEYMFGGCSNLISAPEIKAYKAVLRYSLMGMFSNCSNLNYVKCMLVINTGASATKNWLNHVAATGTFVKDPNATWATGADGIPTGWTVQDA